MKADPFAQLKLLDVQELDARLDQLKHQLEHMPEAAELASLRTRRRDANDRARDTRIRVDDLTREQKKADADVEQVKTRRKRDQDRIEQGLIVSPKDLERMQHELVSLDRRISTLEDAELEVMEQLETAQNELDALTRQLAELDERTAATADALEKKSAVVNAQIAEAQDERTQTASGLPEPLTALYGRLRDQKGGVGAAALRARRCGGCRLELNAADLAVMAKAPSDDVLRCEECNRILVRTTESGI
ncbi:MAG: C4-type zinc ribbon domain-containing protein [Actinomycetota bacterium]|nr:C4-type zinc ribbon domain-containing protein [Actinomycetota bacterium]